MNNHLVSAWSNRLSNVPCFIVGNSPSLNNIDIDEIKDMFTIGINRAFFKFDPTILFWQDRELWMSEQHRLKTSKSIRVCHPKGDPMNRFHHFDIKGGAFRRSPSTGVLHGRGSTGPLAVQFAHALGCKPIYLIGMDCTVDGDNTDFFGINETWKPHTLSLCQTGLNWIKKEFGIEEVINVSSSPHVLKTIVDKFKQHSKGLDAYKRLLLGNN